MFKKDKKEYFAVAIMGLLFLLIYGLVIILIEPFVIRGGVEQVWGEDINNPINILHCKVLER
jgi:hypothetical protein